MSVHYRTCNLCEAMCGLAITVEDGRINDIRGDRDDPFSRGHICPKGAALRDLHEDPDRLRHPIRRTGSGWQRVSWDEALAETAERLSAIRARDGKNAVGLYVGNPTVHNHGAAMALQGFARALGTRNRFDANSQDANPRLLASLLMYGDPLSLAIPDVDRTDFLLMLGANPAASNGSLMTLGDVKGRLRGIAERKGRFVLIDPRRTETAEWATEHHFIRPGADAVLLFAMIQTLFNEGLVRESAVARVATGLAALKAVAARFPPERVTHAVGIAAPTIRQLARDFAAAPRAVAYGRIGTSHSPFGTLASWATDALNVITGNFDREGGAMFPTPAVDLGALARRMVGDSYGRYRSRVRGLPELSGQLPAAVMAEEMETPGEGQIRAFVTMAGNPVMSVPNSARLDAALAKLEFMVSLDIYVNETTRHAHLILPPVGPLERSHYDVVFHGLAVRNTVKHGDPIFDPPPDGKTDWDILWDLGMRLGGMRFGVPFMDRAVSLAWKAGLKPQADQMIDLALRLGERGDKFLPGSKGLSLAKVRAHPHGLDLGPMHPARGQKVRTPDGLVRLAPPILVEDSARLDPWLEQHVAGALSLIGRRHVRNNNSWMHNCPSLSKGPDRSALMVNPVDAAARGIADGQRVRVTSRAGTIEVVVATTEDVMPGVVSLPHGFGHALAKDTMQVAGALPGANANLLTDELFLDPLSGTAALSGVLVTLAPL